MPMQIGEFFKAFREGVALQNNGKALSVAALAALIGMKADTIRSAEKGYKPRDEKDRKRIKFFFGLKDLEDIPNEKLQTSLKNFNLDARLHKVEEELIEAESEEFEAEDEVNMTTVSFDSDANSINSLKSTKTNNLMVNRILDIIAHANSNMEKIAEANLTLARTIENITSGNTPASASRSHVHAKKTEA